MTETRASSETKPPARRGPSQPNADGLMGPGRQPLARALGLAFAVPLILLSLGITAINAWNARRTAEALADAMGTSFSEQVRLQLDPLLAAPRQIIALHQAAIRSGDLDPDNFATMARAFISQMRVFPVGYINYGNQAGEYVGIERLDDGALHLNLTERPRGLNRQFVYAVDSRGRPASEPLKVFQQMSPATQEAWYRETARAGHATWSSIYQWDDKPEVLSVSYNEPLRFGDGRLRGVIGVDVILTQLSKRLSEIWGGRAGLVLITERNGMLVASSKGSPFQSRPGQTPERLRINQSLDPLEREVAQLLFLPGPTGGLRLNQELVHRSSRRGANEQLGTATAFVEALPWSDSHGLDWLVLVIIPRASLTGAIQQQTLLTTLLCLLALLVLLLTTLRLTGWILHPLQELSEAAAALGRTLRRAPGQPLRFTAELPANSAEEIATLHGALASLIATCNGLLSSQRRSGLRLQREVEQKARALDQAIRQERQAAALAEHGERFLGHLGAEMLPPLAALQGNVRLARGASADAGVAQRLDAIQGSADQLSGLARSLRSFAHLGSGQAESLQRPFAPARLLEHEAQAARPAAERKGLSLTLQIASGMPEWLLGDGERLREVLQQLLANAIRFSPTGGIVLGASFREEGPETALLVRVVDSGDGMEPRQVERLLSSDGLAPGPTQPGGTGLGLPLARRLVAVMQGTLQIASLPGDGTTITLTLPFARCDAPVDAAAMPRT